MNLTIDYLFPNQFEWEEAFDNHKINHIPIEPTMGTGTIDTKKEEYIPFEPKRNLILPDLEPLPLQFSETEEERHAYPDGSGKLMKVECDSGTVYTEWRVGTGVHSQPDRLAYVPSTLIQGRGGPAAPRARPPSASSLHFYLIDFQVRGLRLF